MIDGLYVKPPSGSSPYWQLYFRLNDQTIRKSTRQRDLEAAKAVALEHYFHCKSQLQKGVALKRVSFTDLASSYLAAIRHDSKHKYHSATLKRHVMPYFGAVKDITRITSAEIERYLQQRRSKATPPKPPTLNRENTVLRQMFAHALRQGWLQQAPAISQFDEKGARRRRPHFTAEEYRLLHQTGRKRIRAAEKSAQQDGRYIHMVRQRQLLYDVVMLLANSGLRVEELHRITWRDVDFSNRGSIWLNGIGKGGTSREVLLRKTGLQALRRIKQRRMDWLSSKGQLAKVDPQELVVAMPDGKPVKDLKKGFDSLLKEAGLLRSGKDKHSLTSLRHTYATFALSRKHSKRVPIHVLAKAMGTSVRMIEKHYGHVSVRDYEEEVRGDFDDENPYK